MVFVCQPELYEQRQTYRANLWKSNFSSIDGMFDVQGRDEQSQKNSNKQKALLVQAFKDMELKNELDKALDSWVDKGEIILFAGWVYCSFGEFLMLIKISLLRRL